MLRRTTFVLALSSALCLAALTGCSSDEDAAPKPTGPAACLEGTPLVTAKKLTIATDAPALTPWFEGEPSTGKGFESALAYALAKELGFERNAVVWITVPQAEAYAKGDKDFDIGINQVAITPARTPDVDFSTGYYDVPQALVGPGDGAAAEANTLEEIGALRLGTLVGSTSTDFVTATIAPTTEAAAYGVPTDADTAVTDGTIDALVLDLPTAIRKAEALGGGIEVLGRFAPADDAQQFGVVLEKGNPLKRCVDQALSALAKRGTIGKLRATWVEDTVAPLVGEG